MIVFDGYLTDKSQEFFVGKLLNNFSKVVVILLLFTLPIWIFLSNRTNTFIYVMPSMLILILFSPLIFRICVSKKERQRNVPKKVIVNEGIVTSVSDKAIISKNIVQVKEVRDYGDFYYLVLPKRYIDTVFVCQKDLLSKGTLDEFEFLFKDKIIKKKQSKQSGDG